VFRLVGLTYRPDALDGARQDLMRFQSVLPMLPDSVTLGAGWTPISETVLYGQPIWLKEEQRNPTGSFKDRGMAVIANLARRVTGPVIVDSVGNTAAALASFAHEIGLDAHVFAPLKTSAQRVRLIEDLEATLHLVAGPRSETAQAAITAAEDGALYLSHIYQPLFQAGTATVAFEIAEQLPEPPERVFLGVGQGSLFLGLWHGFRALVAAGVLDRIPALIAARPEEPLNTIAVGASALHPAREQEVLDAAKATGGEVVRVPDREIYQATRALSAAGYDVDPAVGLAAAAWRELDARPGPGRDLIIVTGVQRERLRTPSGDPGS